MYLLLLVGEAVELDKVVLIEAVVKDVVVETTNNMEEAIAVEATGASVLSQTVIAGPMALVVIGVGNVKIQLKGISGMPHLTIKLVDPPIIAAIPDSLGAILV